MEFGNSALEHFRRKDGSIVSEIQFQNDVPLFYLIVETFDRFS